MEIGAVWLDYVGELNRASNTLFQAQKWLEDTRERDEVGEAADLMEWVAGWLMGLQDGARQVGTQLQGYDLTDPLTYLETGVVEAVCEGVEILDSLRKCGVTPRSDKPLDKAGIEANTDGGKGAVPLVVDKSDELSQTSARILKAVTSLDPRDDSDTAFWIRQCGVVVEEAVMWREAALADRRRDKGGVLGQELGEFGPHEEDSLQSPYTEEERLTLLGVISDQRKAHEKLKTHVKSMWWWLENEKRMRQVIEEETKFCA